jgi:membrane-bound inhibitor of C-type lysozyme
VKNYVCTGRLRSALRGVSVGACVLFWASTTFATDVNIHLNGDSPISRKQARYECDSEGPKLGLPNGAFAVEYINVGGNSLALLPIDGKTLIFTSGISGSGARYVAQDYVWWEAAGRSISLSRETMGKTSVSACRLVEQP